MKCVITDQVVLLRVAEGPVAAHLGSFADFSSAQGYALYSIRRRVLLAAGVSRWLQQQGFELFHITSDHLARYLSYRARQVQPCRGDAAALRHLIDFLRSEGLIPAEKVLIRERTSAERCAQAYEQYLRDVCALTEATILNYAPFIRCFLTDCFGERPVTLSDLRTSDVVRFV